MLQFDGGVAEVEGQLVLDRVPLGILRVYLLILFEIVFLKIEHVIITN